MNLCALVHLQAFERTRAQAGTQKVENQGKEGGGKGRGKREIAQSGKLHSCDLLNEGMWATGADVGGVLQNFQPFDGMDHGVWAPASWSRGGWVWTLRISSPGAASHILAFRCEPSG